MGTKATLVATFLLLTATAARALEPKDASYFCVTEMSAGLSYDADHKKWDSTRFRPKDKFVLKLRFLGSVQSKDYGEKPIALNQYEVALTPSGQNKSRDCYNTTDFRKPVQAADNWIWCRASLIEYRFNLEANRFISSYMIGYVSGIDNNDNTPAISGGTCTRID